MTTFVFFLVIIAAVTHAGWNFVSKKISGNLLTFWIGTMFVDMCFLPFSIIYTIDHGFNFQGLIPMLVSAGAHSLYYIALFDSYKFGDISAAYPIARGTGVAGTAVISILLFHEAVSHQGILGITFIVTGIILVGMTKNITRSEIKTYIFSICTGICIFLYSVADSKGAGTNHPIVYLNFMSIISLLPVAHLAFKDGIRTSLTKNRGNLKYGPILGIGSLGTYLIILFAFSLSDKASYIVALRECSVIIASVLGFIFLKEKPTPQKIIGIILITAGLVMIKLG